MYFNYAVDGIYFAFQQNLSAFYAASTPIPTSILDMEKNLKRLVIGTSVLNTHNNLLLHRFWNVDEVVVEESLDGWTATIQWARSLAMVQCFWKRECDLQGGGGKMPEVRIAKARELRALVRGQSVSFVISFGGWTILANERFRFVRNNGT